MSLPPTFLAIRALAALLLAVVGLQAVPVQAVGIERHHGSAFDISAVDVATAPALRMASGGEVQRLAPPPPIPAVRITVAAAAPAAAYAPAALPAPTGPPLARELTSLSLAPRAPPFA